MSYLPRGTTMHDVEKREREVGPRTDPDAWDDHARCPECRRMRDVADFRGGVCLSCAPARREQEGAA